ncbi:Deoxycytidine monophosphate (dCMP) deaminase [Mitosporidium daphniae]
MLVGIVGSCTFGNQRIASLLSSHFGFTPIKIVAQESGEIFNSELDALSISKSESNKPRFFSLQQALNFVTVNYHENFVFIHDLSNIKVEYGAFSTRPFYCSLGVKVSPGYFLSFLTQGKVQSLLDLVRLSASAELDHSTAFELAEKIESEDLAFDTFSYCNQVISMDKSLTPANDDVLLDALESSISRLRKNTRPSWDAYFMKIAKLVGQRSNCMKRRVGAILVSRKSHRIISTGYNGTPAGVRNCSEGGCKRCNENTGSGAALSTCLCLHAEENAIFEAGRERISLYTTSALNADDQGVTLYCTSCPCIYCTKKIIQAGISEVVYFESYYMDDFVKSCLKEANIELRMLHE